MEMFFLKRLSRMKEFIRTTPQCLYALFLPVFILLFFTVERLVPADADYWVSYLPLDDRIPFCAPFIVPYCLWYPYLVATGLFLLVKDRAELTRYMLFLMVGFGFSLAFCLVFPNGQNLRPDPLPGNDLFTWLCARIYAADTNTNVLPSMHVIGCCAGVCAAFRSREMKRLRLPSLLLALLICASTVLVKQHSILDIYAGLAVSAVLAVCVYLLPKVLGKKR